MVEHIFVLRQPMYQPCCAEQHVRNSNVQEIQVILK